METQIQHTFCIIKPDGIRRNLTGKILDRFLCAGLKIVAMKMILADKKLAGEHYSWEDIGVRHGEKVRNGLIDFITQSPVIAFVLEGINAVAVVRKICGSTEPSASAPGTVRGDFCHHSYAQSGFTGKCIRNVIHASADEKDAAREISLWFRPEEIFQYRICDQAEHNLD